MLMDVQMLHRFGLSIAHMRKQLSDVKVLMLTISDKDVDLQDALAIGADGYLFRQADANQLYRTIRRMAAK